jgi:hypothetical protein
MNARHFASPLAGDSDWLTKCIRMVNEALTLALLAAIATARRKAGRLPQAAFSGRAVKAGFGSRRQTPSGDGR